MYEILYVSAPLSPPKRRCAEGNARFMAPTRACDTRRRPQRHGGRQGLRHDAGSPDGHGAWPTGTHG
jgi:hypothetical protein